ncbi:MAG TPA: hypothetical protein V6C81_14270 [Planktothrix sp.]|jgi:hypothetical protein
MSKQSTTLALPIAIAMAVGVMGTAWCQTENRFYETSRTHQLPKDGQTAVIVDSSLGGLRRHVSQEPLLQVLADGTVKVGDPFGQGIKMEGKLSAQELQALLGYILDQQHFWDIKPDDLCLRPGLKVTDATTTKVMVECDGSQYEVSCRALGGVHTPVAERLSAIDTRLRQLRDETIQGKHGRR